MTGRGHNLYGGGRGIRTPGTLTGSVVFKTTAIDHSAIPPRRNGRGFMILHDRGFLQRSPELRADRRSWDNSATRLDLSSLPSNAVAVPAHDDELDCRPSRVRRPTCQRRCV